MTALSEQPHKVCLRCGELQRIAEFYTHPRMADGHLNKCKDCCRRAAAENPNRRLNDRRRNLKPERKARLLSSLRQWAADHPKVDRTQRRTWPERFAARIAVAKAIKAGTLVRGPCERGDDTCRGRIEGHHDDYTRQLDVRWLCKKHHADVHREKHDEAAQELAEEMRVQP